MFKLAVLIYLIFGIISTYIFVKTPEAQEILNGMPFMVSVLCAIYSIIMMPFLCIKGAIIGISKRRNRR